MILHLVGAAESKSLYLIFSARQYIDVLWGTLPAFVGRSAALSKMCGRVVI